MKGSSVSIIKASGPWSYTPEVAGVRAREGVDLGVYPAGRTLRIMIFPPAFRGKSSISLVTHDLPVDESFDFS